LRSATLPKVLEKISEGNILNSFSYEPQQDPKLWTRGRDPTANQASGLARTITNIDTGSLVQEFQLDKTSAPRRHDRDKRYIGLQRDGILRFTQRSDRHEEHLMIALFNSAGLACPDGSRVRVIDYQTPLKARRTDRIGKIDGLGLLPNGSLSVMELKSPIVGRGDSPLRALYEGLAYAAVVDANRDRFDIELTELAETHDRFEGYTEVGPSILVFGPRSWWHQWEICAPAGPWKAALGDLGLRLADELGIPIVFGSLEGFEMGEFADAEWGQRPDLTEVPRLNEVAGLPPLIP
jgi:hypothetical protein